MEDFNLDDSPKDLGRHRTLALENGNKVHFKCSDPFGFWTINMDKGKIPESLSGNYTTFDHAEKAMRAYLNSKGKEVAEPEPVETLFETKTKSKSKAA